MRWVLEIVLRLQQIQVAENYRFLFLFFSEKESPGMILIRIWHRLYKSSREHLAMMIKE